METIKLETKRTNEKREVLYDFPRAEVKIDYFWDSHGNLIDWNEQAEDPRHWESAHAQIELYSFTESFGNHSEDFQITRLVVDGKRIGGDIIEATKRINPDGSITALVKIAIGWG